MYTGIHSLCCIIFYKQMGLLVRRLLNISLFKCKSGKFPPNLYLQVSTKQLDLPPKFTHCKHSLSFACSCLPEGQGPMGRQCFTHVLIGQECYLHQNALELLRQAVTLRAHIPVSVLHVLHTSVKSLQNLRTNFHVLTEPFFIFLSHCNKESQYHLSNYSHRAIKLFSNNLIRLLFAGKCHDLKYF